MNFLEGQIHFNERFERFPRLRFGMHSFDVDSDHLAGPVVVRLAKPDQMTQASVRFGMASYRLNWQSVSQVDLSETSICCPILRSESLREPMILCGPWTIPISKFGPGVALSPDAQSVTIQLMERWKDCHLQANLEDEGWLEGWFFHSESKGKPGLRNYQVRTVNGAWLSWDLMSFEGQQFVPLRSGQRVRFKVRFAEKVPWIRAFDISSIDDSAAQSQKDSLIRFEILRHPQQPGRLQAGDIILYQPNGLELPTGMSSVGLHVVWNDHGGWTFRYHGRLAKQAKSQKKSIEVQTNTSEVVPEHAIPSVGGRHKLINELENILKSLAVCADSADPDQDLFEEKLLEFQQAMEQKTTQHNFRTIEQQAEILLRKYAITLSEEYKARIPRLSHLVASLLRRASSLTQGDRREAWHARWGMIVIHLLSGSVVAEPDQYDKSTSDPVLNILREATDMSITHAFLKDHGLGMWDTLAHLGELGFRLKDSTLRRGCSAYDLVSVYGWSQNFNQDSQERGVSLRVVCHYGDGYESIPIIREMLSQTPRGSAKLLILCIADRAAPGAQQLYSQSEAVAELGTALFYCPTNRDKLDETKLAVRRSADRLDIIRNPILSFSDESRNLTPVQFVMRPKLMANLTAILETSREPVSIYSMRKAGKTATAISLGITNRFHNRYVNLGELVPLTNSPNSEIDVLTARIEKEIQGEKPLLILDEFDTFCRVLAGIPFGDAIRFLRWIEVRARSHPVLCLGIDPTAIRLVYPESNPLQTVKPFLLPYFDLDESLSFASVLASNLVVPRETTEQIWQLSGGHPVVMKNLFMASLTDSLDYPENVITIQRRTPIVFSQRLFDSLMSKEGVVTARGSEISRNSILERILATRTSQVPAIHDGWAVLTRLANLPSNTFDITLATEITEEALRCVGKDPARPVSDLLRQLTHWGLLRSEGIHQYSFGIPLLRCELTRGEWKCWN